MSVGDIDEARQRRHGIEDDETRARAREEALARVAERDAVFSRAREAHLSGEALLGKLAAPPEEKRDLAGDREMLESMRARPELFPQFTDAGFEMRDGTIDVNFKDGSQFTVSQGDVAQISGPQGLDRGLDFLAERYLAVAPAIFASGDTPINMGSYIAMLAAERGMYVALSPVTPETSDRADVAPEVEQSQPPMHGSSGDRQQEPTTEELEPAAAAEAQTIEIADNLPEAIRSDERWADWKQSVSDRWQSHFEAARNAHREVDERVDACGRAFALRQRVQAGDAVLAVEIENLRDEFGARPLTERQMGWERNLGHAEVAAAVLLDEGRLKTAMSAEREELRQAQGFEPEQGLEPERLAFTAHIGRRNGFSREFIDEDGARLFVLDGKREQIRGIATASAFDQGVLLAGKSWGAVSLSGDLADPARQAHWALDRCIRLGVRVANSELADLQRTLSAKYDRERMEAKIMLDNAANLEIWTKAQGGRAPTQITRDGESARQEEHRAGLELQYGARSANRSQKVSGEVIGRETTDDRTHLVIRDQTSGRNILIAMDRDDARGLKVGQAVAFGIEDARGLRERETEREAHIERLREQNTGLQIDHP